MNASEFIDTYQEELGFDPTFETIIKVVHRLGTLQLFDLAVDLSTLDTDAMAVGISEGIKEWWDDKQAENRMIEQMKYV